jgi:hypothetical protein
MASDNVREISRFYPICFSAKDKIYFGAGGKGLGADPNNKAGFNGFILI